jgi:phosphate uptake regulator
MLGDGRHVFDAAAAAFLGAADPEVVSADLIRTDKEINRRERQIRREILVHATVYGSPTFSSCLVLMAITKDAERIGDYAKNVWDLAANDVDFSGGSDTDRLAGFRNRTSRLISEAARIFNERDTQAAHSIIQEGDTWQDEYDEFITEQIESDRPAAEAVPRALFARYLKRITAHALNVLTSLVMPVHRLDYYDEDKADR